MFIRQVPSADHKNTARNRFTVWTKRIFTSLTSVYVSALDSSTQIIKSNLESFRTVMKFQNMFEIQQPFESASI